MAEINVAFLRLKSHLDEVRQAIPKDVKWSIIFEDLSKLEAKIIKLQDELDQLQTPPLYYGTFLGLSSTPSTNGFNQRTEDDQQSLFKQLEQLLDSTIEKASSGEQEKLRNIREGLQEIKDQFSTTRDVIIGRFGQRLEVSLTNSDISLGDLYEGQEVILNNKLNVVGVTEQRMRGGDTAEVVDILTPVGTAKVLILEDNRRLLVEWPSGDKKDVTCDPELFNSLQRGDIVQIDDSRQRATAKVKPRLHVVRYGGSVGTVVEMSDQLFNDGVEIGDTVRVDFGLEFAVEKLSSHKAKDLILREVPDITYEDIGGLEDQIKKLRDAIEPPYIHRHLYDKYKMTRPKGILLHGPPGCGKTMIAKAMANGLTKIIRKHLEELSRNIRYYLNLQRPNNQAALRSYQREMNNKNMTLEEALSQLKQKVQDNGINTDLMNLEDELRRIQDILEGERKIHSFFYNVQGPELLNMWLGETEQRIRNLFEEAKRQATFYTPVIIFFDEMEALFHHRDYSKISNVQLTILPQFLAAIDGVEGLENVIVIGASNRFDLIDPAIMRPGRLDVKVKIERPVREAAMDILALYLTPYLPLQADGLRQHPNADSCKLTFKRKVVQDTICKIGVELASDGELQKLIECIPDHCDVRHAIDKKCEDLADLCLHNRQIRRVVEEIRKRELLAEAIIIEAVELLYNRNSYLEVRTLNVDKLHTFQLSRFVSGATLKSIVERAKKSAFDRHRTETHIETEPGISIADLHMALRQEFEENANQLASAELEQQLGKVEDVTVHLAENEEEDPWSLEKIRPYAGESL